MTVALGKAAVPSLPRMPLIWSPWKWLMTIVSTCAGSMPAAARLRRHAPAVGGANSPRLVSIRTVCCGVRTTVVVNGMTSVSVGWNAAASAACTSASSALRTKLGVQRPRGEPVMDPDHLDPANLEPVERRRLPGHSASPACRRHPRMLAPWSPPSRRGRWRSPAVERGPWPVSDSSGGKRRRSGVARSPAKTLYGWDNRSRERGGDCRRRSPCRDEASPRLWRGRSRHISPSPISRSR